jgi:hypothetical protein
VSGSPVELGAEKNSCAYDLQEWSNTTQAASVSDDGQHSPMEKGVIAMGIANSKYYFSEALPRSLFGTAHWRFPNETPLTCPLAASVLGSVAFPPRLHIKLELIEFSLEIWYRE